MPGGIHLLIGLFLLFLISLIYRPPPPTTTSSPKSSSTTSSTTQQEENNDEKNRQHQEQRTITTTTISNYEKRMQWIRWGIMIGSVLPDADLIVAISAVCFCYIFLGYTTENVALAESLHRSWSHSLIFWVPFFLLCTVLLFQYPFAPSSLSSSLSSSSSTHHRQKLKRKSRKNQQKLQNGNDKSSTSTSSSNNRNNNSSNNSDNTKIDWIGFLFGLSLGVVVHVLFDTSYMKGVCMFWPVYKEEIFIEVPLLRLHAHTWYSPWMQKLIMGFDHVSEVPIYILLFWIRRRLIDGGYLVSDKRLSTFTNREDHSRVWKALLRGQLLQLSESEWVYVYRHVILLQTGLIFVFWFIGSVLFPQMEFVHFFVLMYFPGTVFMLFSLMAPLTFKRTIQHMSPTHVLSSVGIIRRPPSTVAGAKKVEWKNE